jgi:hypothetical protein
VGKGYLSVPSDQGRGDLFVTIFFEDIGWCAVVRNFQTEVLGLRACRSQRAAAKELDRVKRLLINAPNGDVRSVLADWTQHIYAPGIWWERG